MTPEDAVAELRNAALIAALSRPTPQQPPTGTDGEQTCRRCAPLAEQLREHKLADQARRERAFSAGEVEVSRYYCRQAAVALSQGRTRASVWGEETRRITGQSSSTATRLHKAWRKIQDGPEIGPALPFRIETEVRNGKEHIEIVVPAVPDDPAERTTAGMLAKIVHLKRPGDRAGHGGERVACPKHPDAPVQRTRIWRCTEDGCTWVHQDTHLLGEQPNERDAPVRMGGDFYAVEVQGPAPFHDEVKRERTYSKQDETVPLTPVSFVSGEDMQWADDPHYRGEAPPAEPPPPRPLPIAPRSHIARAFRAMPLPAAAGGLE